MVYVFKTTVTSKKGIKKVKPFLDQLIPNSHWNFDLQDCDRILRVASAEIATEKVIETLRANGFECAELD